jgi:Flp pilus assembly pilin Flp
MRSFSKIIRNDQGQGLTEYLILLLLIAVISIGATRTLGSTIKGKLEMAERHISSKVSLEDND